MKKYIEREALVEALDSIIGIAKICKEAGAKPDPLEMLSALREDVKTCPTADVRPVVLCRDCRWWAKEEKSLQGRNTGMNICQLGGFYPTGEWFCANGERPNCGAQMKEETQG